MSGKRKALGKKLRFEVLKRDSFACQYCGATAPEVVLHIDHIHPVAEGGGNDLLNLVTACAGCNSGKGARKLSDKSAVQRSRVQLVALQERREQLEMMLEWQRSLAAESSSDVDQAACFFEELGSGYSCGDAVRAEMKKQTRRHGVFKVLTALREAACEKFKETESGETDIQSASDALELAWKLLSVWEATGDNPHGRDAFYIRGILARRFGYQAKNANALALLLQALEAGSTPFFEKAWANDAPSYDEWERQMKAQVAE